MLRTRRLQDSAVAYAVTRAAGIVTAGLITLAGMAVLPLTASAETDDGTLTVIVDRDVDRNGSYSSEIDQPQRDIEIVVTDAAGKSVQGVTGSDGRFVLRATPKLTGGRYFVVAKIPASLGGLTPVSESSTFQPLSTTVDLTSENQTVRMGVAVGRTGTEPPPSQPTTVSRGSDRPELARFAVGDLVWRDDNRSGVQDPSESGASGISVQLLNADGEVVASTVSGPTGHYQFDNLPAGTYSVRFAGIPADFRLTPTGVGDQRGVDSDPDYSGAIPPFTLGVGEPNIRPATAADEVAAAYINTTIDAGITPLRYAVGDRVWFDLNTDGIQQPDEPAGSATVSLLTDAGNVVATTTTDATGHYEFANLRAGRYRLQFAGLPPHRTFTARGDAGNDATLDSDPDPATGRTAVFDLAQGAPNLIPVTSADAGSTDFENQTMSAGLVCAYSVGDKVWRDNDGDGVLDAGDSGLRGVTVELLGNDSQVLARTVSTENGRYDFDHLAAGNYRVRFTKPDGLVFTSRDAAENPAVDSDADQAGMTSVFALGNENPADTSIDAGLTTPANYRGVAGAHRPPVDTALSSTGGVALPIPIVGAVLALAGLTCLVVSRRRRSI